MQPRVLFHPDVEQLGEIQPGGSFSILTEKALISTLPVTEMILTWGQFRSELKSYVSLNVPLKYFVTF